MFRLSNLSIFISCGWAKHSKKGQKGDVVQFMVAKGRTVMKPSLVCDYDHYGRGEQVRQGAVNVPCCLETPTNLPQEALLTVSRACCTARIHPLKKWNWWQDHEPDLQVIAHLVIYHEVP